MLQRFLSLATVAMLALVVLAACGPDGGEDDEDPVTRVPATGAPPTMTPAPEEPATPAGEASPATSPAASPAASPVGEATPSPDGAAAAEVIEGFDIGWEYEEQRTAPGQPITVTVAPGTTITLPNVGAAPHNFSIDAFDLDVDMPPAQTVEATIPADAAPGEYEFYCNVPGHVQAGMVGTLVVE